MNAAEKAAREAPRDGESLDPLLEALDAYHDTITRAGEAKRALDDAYAAREIALEPPPHLPGSPADEEAWEERMGDEWRDAYDRVLALRSTYDAVPDVDLSPLDDPGISHDERFRIHEAEHERSSTIIPLILELEQAERDLRAATAALARIPHEDDEGE